MCVCRCCKRVAADRLLLQRVCRYIEYDDAARSVDVECVCVDAASVSMQRLLQCSGCINAASASMQRAHQCSECVDTLSVSMQRACRCSECVDAASVTMLRMCRSCVCLWYICGLASVVIIRFIVDNDERFDCSIGRARLNRSFGAVDL